MKKFLNGLQVIGSLIGDLTGNADTATKLATARKINGVPFDGSGDITFESSGGGTPIGGIIFWGTPTPPTNFLECNGDAILCSSYSTFTSVFYCGDTYNATASYGYKCTDPANPAGSRNTTGSYIVLPETRGEFPRGWDHGRGVDPGRALRTAQADELRSHRHAITLQDSGAWSIIPEHSDGDGGASTGYTEYTGGSETRPRNMSFMFIIRVN